MTRAPPELCIGSEVNLSRWSMVVTDENLMMMCDQPDMHYKVESSEAFVANMFKKFWEPSFLDNRLQTLILCMLSRINACMLDRQSNA